MAWGDPSDYWWLQPKQPDNPLAAMQFGAQLKQQAIANALREKDLELENARTGIAIQEYFSKKELQNNIEKGNAELAKTISANFANGFTADTPEFQSAIYEVANKYPMVMQGPAWKGIESMGLDAARAAEQRDYHRSIIEERAASNAARIAQQRANTLARMDYLYTQLSSNEKLKGDANRIAELRATTQSLLADSRIAVDDERIRKLIADTEAIGARTAIAEGNLEQRKIENELSRERLHSRLNDVQYAQFQSELSAAQRANRGDAAKLRAAEQVVYDKWNAVLKPPTSPAGTGLDLKLKDGWKIEPVK